jgi:uncharacterized membrane protein YedE/YeeE
MTADDQIAKLIIGYGMFGVGCGFGGGVIASTAVTAGNASGYLLAAGLAMVGGLIIAIRTPWPRVGGDSA